MSNESVWTRRVTQLLLALLSVGVWALVLYGRPASAHLETLTVGRIDLVDSDGTTRLVLANSDSFPDLLYRGRTYERSIDDTAGLLFYDENGDEAGGLVIAKLGEREQSAIILDYTHQITDGVGIVKRESEDGGSWEAGMFVRDRRPYAPGAVESSQGTDRITLMNTDQHARLEISDPQGRPRIRLGVAADGEPYVHVLGENGDVVFDAGSTAISR